MEEPLTKGKGQQIPCSKCFKFYACAEQHPRENVQTVTSSWLFTSNIPLIGHLVRIIWCIIKDQRWEFLPFSDHLWPSVQLTGEFSTAQWSLHSVDIDYSVGSRSQFWSTQLPYTILNNYSTRYLILLRTPSGAESDLVRPSDHI